jgi:hypothetical protein
MIKFNQTYTINNGQESIVFKEGKANTIKGEYNDGTLTGTLEGNVLKATFHNKKTNGAGLIEFTFTENGFSAKWKQGLEPGPMRGKWKGNLGNDIGNNLFLQTDISLEEFKNIVISKVKLPKSEQIEFCKELIEFTSENTEMLWLIPCLLSTKQLIIDKIDDGELEDAEDSLFWGSEFNELLPSYSFKYKALYWQERELKFAIDEDEEPSDLIDLILNNIDLSLDQVIDDYNNYISGDEHTIFLQFKNELKTVFYSTICKAFAEMDEHYYSVEDLANLLVSPFEHEYVNQIESKTDDFGGVMFEVVEDVLYCFGVDLEDDEYDEEWGNYSKNYEAIVEFIIGSETYDTDLD